MEYYTVEKKNNLGEQYIELSVFQAITNHEVSKINGIDFDGGKNSVNIEINDILALEMLKWILMSIKLNSRDCLAIPFLLCLFI